MWRPMETLVAGRLAYLNFENAGAGNCLGYVNGAGRVEWPDVVMGLRPDGWREVTDMLRPNPETEVVARRA